MGSSKDIVQLAFLRLSVVALLFSTNLAIANTQQEIDHLLEFVAGSDCKYERNGALHDGSEASGHIRMKYDYYKNRVETTEDFIRYSATRSKLSGRKYRVHCPDANAIDSSDWLLQELREYRQREAR